MINPTNILGKTPMFELLSDCFSSGVILRFFYRTLIQTLGRPHIKKTFHVVINELRAQNIRK